MQHFIDVIKHSFCNLDDPRSSKDVMCQLPITSEDANMPSTERNHLQESVVTSSYMSTLENEFAIGR